MNENKYNDFIEKQDDNKDFKNSNRAMELFEDNVDEKKEKVSLYKEIKIYLKILVVLIAIVACIMCFLPICNGTVGKYDELLKLKSLDETEEKDTSKEKKDKELEINRIDSLELKREVSDVIVEFMRALKNAEYEKAYDFLAVDESSSVDSSLRGSVEYNKDFLYFRRYLENYDYNVSDVVINANKATARLKIKRFDINRMVNKLISDKIKEGKEDEFEVLGNNKDKYEEFFEDELFKYEDFFEKEFEKTNAYKRESEFDINLVKVDDTWKIVNDDELEANVINLDFRMAKSGEEIKKGKQKQKEKISNN